MPISKLYKIILATARKWHSQLFWHLILYCIGAHVPEFSNIQYRHIFSPSQNQVDSLATVLLNIEFYRLILNLFAIPSFFAFHGVILHAYFAFVLLGSSLCFSGGITKFTYMWASAGKKRMLNKFHEYQLRYNFTVWKNCRHLHKFSSAQLYCFSIIVLWIAALS